MKRNSRTLLSHIEQLSADAKLINEADYESDRQMAAQEKLAKAVEALLTKEEIAELARELVISKADTNEIADEYLAVARRKLGVSRK